MHIINCDMGPVNCDICGKTIDAAKGIPFKVWVSDDHDEFKDFTEMFGRSELNSCLCCLAKNNGFKPLETS